MLPIVISNLDTISCENRKSLRIIGEIEFRILHEDIPGLARAVDIFPSRCVREGEFVGCPADDVTYGICWK